MRTRFIGYALQVLGVVLIVLGFAICGTMFALSTSYRPVPFWVFVLGGCVLGLPPILVGSYLHICGSFWRGTASAQHQQQYDEFAPATKIACFVWPVTWGATAPVFVRAAGLADLSTTFLLVWAVGWVLVFGAGGFWIVRSLWPRIERRLAKRRGTFDLKPPRL